MGYEDRYNVVFFATCHEGVELPDPAESHDVRARVWCSREQADALLDGDHNVQRERRSMVFRGFDLDLLDLPEGGWNRSEPSRRGYGDPLRPMVESGGGGPGNGPCAPYWADPYCVGLSAHRTWHGGGEDPAAVREEA